MPTTPKPTKSLAALAPSKSPYRLKDWLCTKVPNDLLPPTPLPAYAVTSIATCTKPPTSRAKEDTGLKSLFVIAPSMPGARTLVRCVTGVARRAITLKNVTPLAIADTVYDVATMGWTAFTPTIYATSSKTVRSTPLTPTLNAAIVLLLTMTLTSKGH